MKSRATNTKEMLLGNRVVDGIAIGYVKTYESDLSGFHKDYKKDSIDEELEKFLGAQQKIIKEHKEALELLDPDSGEAKIMEVHLFLLDDLMLVEEIKKNINLGHSAPKSIENASETIQGIFKELNDPYLEERIDDVKDICKQIIYSLYGIEKFKVTQKDTIVVAKDLEPSVIAGFSTENVVGIILENGSTTSHTIIIARSKGIPTLVGVDVDKIQQHEGDCIIIDDNSRLHLNPTEEKITTTKIKKEKELKKKEYYLAHAFAPAITLNKKEITIAANICEENEVDLIRDNGAEGVGLFRTEFLFMGKAQLPTEDEQFKVYKKVVSSVDHQLCIIRTMDIGGDKPLPSIQMEVEDNPFLGYRAIRICMDRTEVFKTQLRSIIRASAFGKVAIMIPMVINLNEILATKKQIEAIKAELITDGIAFDSDIQLGIMVETPAAMMMADVFSKHVDFFSIGTNDLVQYMLAVDRGNQKVAYLYDYFNPAILRAIHQTVTAAHKEGKWVGVCGEMGSDIKGIIALLSIGVDELSMSPINIPKVKEMVRHINTEEMSVEKLLTCSTANEVKIFLEEIESHIQKRIEK